MAVRFRISEARRTNERLRGLTSVYGLVFNARTIVEATAADARALGFSVAQQIAEVHAECVAAANDNGIAFGRRGPSRHAQRVERMVRAAQDYRGEAPEPMALLALSVVCAVDDGRDRDSCWRVIELSRDTRDQLAAYRAVRAKAQ